MLHLHLTVSESCTKEVAGVGDVTLLCFQRVLFLTKQRLSSSRLLIKGECSALYYSFQCSEVLKQFAKQQPLLLVLNSSVQT